MPLVFYFAEPPVRSYQLRQWLPVIEVLREHHPVAVLTRVRATTRLLRELTDVPVHYARTLDAMLTTYAALDPKVVVYCNNGMRNFQSLSYRRALHVHVNHGESDKLVMASNQAKAYDRVVVAGQAAIDRYRDNLLLFDQDKFVLVGRPQLDVSTPCEISAAPDGVRTVLYAPTWHGEDAGNDYSSLDVYGPAIVAAALADADNRVVYKPHPRTLTATDPGIVAAHEGVLALLAGANAKLGIERHVAALEADILGLFEVTDLLVTDVSSVGLDFLYLRPEASIVLTDRFSDRAALNRLSPLSRATDVVDASSIHELQDLIASNLAEDPHHDERLQMSAHYFGMAKGQSTAQLVGFLNSCIADRDALVAAVDLHRAPEPTGDHFDRASEEKAGGEMASE